jgi:hypothetical protein
MEFRHANASRWFFIIWQFLTLILLIKYNELITFLCVHSKILALCNLSEPENVNNVEEVKRTNKMDDMEFRQPAHVQEVLGNPKHF